MVASYIIWEVAQPSSTQQRGHNGVKKPYSRLLEGPRPNNNMLYLAAEARCRRTVQSGTDATDAARSWASSHSSSLGSMYHSAIRQ